ncbi:MAG TPA: hypothetical protein VK808_03190 [Bacteroidia bacterium]|nr:hypothetical protein [Bacteroidia bacterium]
MDKEETNPKDEIDSAIAELIELYSKDLSGESVKRKIDDLYEVGGEGGKKIRFMQVLRLEARNRSDVSFYLKEIILKHCSYKIAKDKHLTEEEKLDLTLNFYRKIYYLRYSKDELTENVFRWGNGVMLMLELGEFADDGVFLERISYLINEGYLKETPKPNHEEFNNRDIQCTYKGYVFKGFVKDKEEKEAESRRRIRNDDRLSKGTIALAVGTFLIVAVEIFRWWWENIHTDNDIMKIIFHP